METPLLKHSNPSYQATPYLSHDRAVHSGDPELSTWQMILLASCMIGVQFTWTVELSYGTPYLTGSLELSKELTALVWLAGPLSGLIIQPLIGALSDRSTSRFGRRRPYIIFGAVLVCLAMLGVAYAKDLALMWVDYRTKTTDGVKDDRQAELKRTAIIIAVFSFYFLDFSLNAIQACCRALILDIPPLHQQELANAWAGRLNNLSMVAGYFVGNIDLVHHLPWLGDGQMKIFCNLAIIVLIISLSITCLAIEEKSYVEIEWDSRPWYHTLGYIWRAFRHLPSPVQKLCNVQFFAWMGWFPFLFYSTMWVSDIYFEHQPAGEPAWDEGARAGSFALLCFSVISFIAGVTLPALTPTISTVQSIFTIKNMYTASHLVFAIAMLSTFFVDSVTGATLALAALGVPWAVMMWVPFALVGEFIASEEERKLEESTNVMPSRRLVIPNPVGALFPPEDEEDDLGVGSSSSVAPTSDIVLESQSQQEEFDAGMILGVHNMYIVFPQFIVAVIAAGIFRLFDDNSRTPPGPPDQEEHSPEGVAWVLRFGGVMAVVAMALSRYVVEVIEERGKTKGKSKEKGKGKGPDAKVTGII